MQFAGSTDAVGEFHTSFGAKGASRMTINAVILRL